MRGSTWQGAERCDVRGRDAQRRAVHGGARPPLRARRLRIDRLRRAARRRIVGSADGGSCAGWAGETDDGSGQGPIYCYGLYSYGLQAGDGSGQGPMYSYGPYMAYTPMIVEAKVHPLPS